MKTIDEKIAVMQAYKEGKKIESRNDVTEEWHTAPCPTWDWSYYDYRVKPEPHYVPYDTVLDVERDKWVRKKNGRKRYAEYQLLILMIIRYALIYVVGLRLRPCLKNLSTRMEVLVERWWKNEKSN